MIAAHAGIMKKLLVFAFTALLGASLASFAQTPGSSTKPATTTTKAKKHHHKKGTHKAKTSASATSTKSSK
jgi:hypothetical protein